MAPYSSARDIPVLADLLDKADRHDVKTACCKKSLREFIAAMLSYMPGWMRLLYRLRGVLVRLLGTRQEIVHEKADLTAESVSFTPGDPAGFFTVVAAEEDRFWVCEARDKIISGYVAVVTEPLENGENRFRILCMARYRHWTAHIYYNVINLFHHLVVRSMTRHACR